MKHPDSFKDHHEDLNLNEILAGADEKMIQNVDPELVRIARSNIIQMDTDHDHKISSKEVFNGMLKAVQEAYNAKLEARAAKQNTRRWQILVVLLCVIVGSLSLSNYFTSVTAMRAVKDTYLDGQALVDENNQAISVNTNILELPLGVVSFMPRSVVSNIKEISIEEYSASDPGTIEAVHHFNLGRVSVVENTSFEMHTTTSDILVWDSMVNGGDSVNLTMANGKTLSINPVCSSCSAVSVVETDETASSYSEFEEFFGIEEGDHEVDQEKDIKAPSTRRRVRRLSHRCTKAAKRRE